MAIVGNNSHLYEYEEVPEEEAKKFADENNAIFALVSSEVNYRISRIDDLFVSIGKKILKQNLIMASKLRIKNKEKKEKKKKKETKETMEMVFNKKLIKYIDY